MTEQYKKRLLELAKQMRELMDDSKIEMDSPIYSGEHIRFHGHLHHLLGFIEALEDSE